MVQKSRNEAAREELAKAQPELAKPPGPLQPFLTSLTPVTEPTEPF